MKVAIELPSAQATPLENEVKRLGVSVEELARAAVADLLAAPDAAFQAAAKRSRAQNLDLYRHLAWMRYLTLGEVVALHRPFWPPPGAPKAFAISARSSPRPPMSKSS
jgi:hypothetical protein